MSISVVYLYSLVSLAFSSVIHFNISFYFFLLFIYFYFIFILFLLSFSLLSSHVQEYKNFHAIISRSLSTDYSCLPNINTIIIRGKSSRIISDPFFKISSSFYSLAILSVTSPFSHTILSYMHIKHTYKKQTEEIV